MNPTFLNIAFVPGLDCEENVEVFMNSIKKRMKIALFA